MTTKFLLFVVFSVFVVAGTPCALADEIVDITVPTTSFEGIPYCPGCGPCPPNSYCYIAGTFSASFQYDNTTATTILESVNIDSTGAIGPYFFLDSSFSKQTNQVGFSFEDDTFGLINFT